MWKQRVTMMEYDSGLKRSPLFSELIELFRYRDLLYLMTLTSIKRRYKRSTLGIIWSLLGPLLTMAVLTIAFSNLFRFSLINYPIYLLSGLIFWNLFTQTTQDAMNSLIWGGNLLRRIYVPRTVFSITAINTGLINLFLAFIPLAIIMLILRHPFRPALFFLPFAILLIAMFALGVGLILSTMSVFFIDVVYIYQVVISAWFYLTPIIYPRDIFPAQYVWYMNFNPLYNLLELFRVPIYLGLIPGTNTILAASLWAGISLLIGFWVFTKKADEFAYRI